MRYKYAHASQYKKRSLDARAELRMSRADDPAFQSTSSRVVPARQKSGARIRRVAARTRRLTVLNNRRWRTVNTARYIQM